MKMVKVARVGGKVVEVVIPSGATIAQALAAAGIEMLQNEDVYENHVLRSQGTNVLAGAIVIVEPRKRQPLSHSLVRFINALIDEEVIDGEDYENEDCEIDMYDLYDDNKSMIDNLVSMAKEV